MQSFLRMPLLAAACCALGAFGVSLEHTGAHPEETVKAFHSFLGQHGRAYRRGSLEYERRLAVFARRAAEVKSHNARPGRLWTAGINLLSDRTKEELAQLRGWRGAATPGARQGAAGRSTPSTFLSQRSKAKPMPNTTTFNWTHLQSLEQVIDQGSCGSCWAVASITVLQTHAEIHGPDKNRTFSAQELVECVPNPHSCGGDGGCSGATVELAFDWALNRGLATERDTPYMGSDGVCKKTGGGPQQQQLVQTPLGQDHSNLEELVAPGVHHAVPGSPGAVFGLKAWERLAENSYLPLLQAVFERGPVGVSAAADGWNSYDSGIFDSCGKDVVINHAVTLIGFGMDQKLGGKKFWLIRNSWGPSWGEGGNIRLLRHEGDDEHCGTDTQPEAGTGCKGGPLEVTVCGMCGVLYDSVVPHF